MLFTDETLHQPASIGDGAEGASPPVYVGSPVNAFADDEGWFGGWTEGWFEGEGDWLDKAANFSAGWGDVLSFSTTYYARELLGINEGIKTVSLFYQAGVVTGTIHQTAMLKFGPKNSIQVTSWAEAGTVADLNATRWVQIGGPSYWNYIKTGLWGPKGNFTSKFPYFEILPSNSPFSNYISAFIDQTKLMWPKGWESWKGLLGQRIIK